MNIIIFAFHLSSQFCWQYICLQTTLFSTLLNTCLAVKDSMIDFKFCCLLKSKWDQHIVLQQFVCWIWTGLHTHLCIASRIHPPDTYTHIHTHTIKPTNNLLDNNHSNNSNISNTNNRFGPKQIQVIQLISNSFIKILLCWYEFCGAKLPHEAERGPHWTTFPLPTTPLK